MSNLLIKLYLFNEYELNDKKAVQIAKLMLEVYPNIKEEQAVIFFDRVSKGEFGMLYKMPTCIMSMFQKYVKEPENVIPNFNSGSSR